MVPPMTPVIVPNAVHHMPWLPFTFSNAWSQGIEVFKAQYVLLLAAGGIAMGVQMVQSVVGQVFSLLGQIVDPTAGMIASVLFSLIMTVLVTWPMQVSTQYVGVAARRGEQISMPLLFRGFYRMGTAILTMFLTSLVALACAIPCILIIAPMVIMLRSGQVSTEVGVIVIILAAMINGVAIGYVMARLYLAAGMCVDSRLGDLTATQSLKMSWEWTRERGWLVFGVMLTVGLVAASSVLLMCVGYFLVGVPLMLAVYGAMYHQLGFDRGVFPTRQVCPVCDYDLSGVNAVTCPECGANVAGYTTANAYAHYGVPPTGVPHPGSPQPGMNQPDASRPGSMPPRDPFGPRDPLDPRDPSRLRDPYGPRQ